VSGVPGVWVKMSDPRNVAHDKKVTQQKQHKDEKAAVAEQRESVTEAPNGEHASGELEKSTAVLSKLKEMEFHSRANIETLAGLTLTIDDELKQKEFSDAIGALYSAQDGFQTQVAALVESYGAKCESLKPSA
jgi:molecular chaperone GrpE (heat shock protein)